MGDRLRAFEQSDDVAQSALREVLQDLDGRALRDVEDLDAWVRLCIERKLSDRARFHGRQKRDAARLGGGLNGNEPLDEQTPSRLVSAREQAERVESAYLEALASLDADERVAIQLLRGGASYAEVGERIGRSTGAARMFVSRARSRLGMAMKRGLGESP